MQELLSKAENDRIVFVESFKDLQFVENLPQKQLCIIKTDFKDINKIKKLCKQIPHLEIWLTSEEISRKNILAANSCGIKNVLPYPVETRLIHEFFRKKECIETHENEYINTDILNGLKVMIVDDNQMNIDLLLETLSKMGLNISTFINPQEAGQAVHNEKFDLFLLDIMMPEMSGFDLAQEIKKSELNINTPIIFISALCAPEDKIRSYNLGSLAYIEKPFNVKVVRSQIYNTLKTKLLRDALYDKKETFLAMVTHDLKSPVNAEICALEFLLENAPAPLDDFHNEIVKDVLGAAKYMKNLLDNLLNKYKFDNERFVLNKKYYSLEALLTECIDKIKYLFREKNQSIVLKCNNKDTGIFMDYLEIKRVVDNLLINAHQYSAKNSLVEVELFGNEKYLSCCVKNLPVYGMSQNPTEMFQKDFTSNGKQKTLGTGLGLYISKQIIESHGGEICAVSKKFVEITFTLPRNNEE